ncbi:MAG: hypothetical protein K0V04_25595, partial [Deltaproteobacteria bacterium]|nr:hypothetical protein [Deltaproteobacteria bacterium]
GVEIRNLRHLIELVEQASGQFLTFQAEDGSRLVLDREEARSRTASIMKSYGVPADRSPELRGKAVDA